MVTAFSTQSVEELDRIARSEFVGRERLEQLEIELLSRNGPECQSVLAHVRSRLAVLKGEHFVPATVRDVSITAHAVSATPIISGSTYVLRTLAICGTVVLTYVNASYVATVWQDTRAQQGRLWLMVISLLVVGVPLMFPLTIVGTIAPLLVGWNRTGTVLRASFGLLLAFLFGPLIAQIPWAVWSFVMLLLK